MAQPFFGVVWAVVDTCRVEYYFHVSPASSVYLWVESDDFDWVDPFFHWGVYYIGGAVVFEAGGSGAGGVVVCA